jgi:hypothetical protein
VVSHHEEIFLLIPRSLLRGGFIGLLAIVAGFVWRVEGGGMAVLPLYRCMRFPSRPPRRQAFLILWRQADAGEVVISSSHCGNFGGGVARRFALVVLTRCAEDIPVAFGHHRQCKRPVAAIAVVGMAHGHAPVLCMVLTMTRGKTGRKAARSPQGTGQHGHVERAGH